MSPVAIPLLPCRALDEVVPFYESLGFETVHRQQRPNPYAALQWQGVGVHFFGVATHDPAKAYGMCLVIVPEVERLHARFKEAAGLPARGTPRITRMKPGQSRFTVVDPAGNSVIYIKRGEKNPHEPQPAGRTPLAKAMRAAEVLRDYKNDDAAALKVLEVALGKAKDAEPAELAAARAMLHELRAAIG